MSLSNTPLRLSVGGLTVAVSTDDPHIALRAPKSHRHFCVSGAAADAMVTVSRRSFDLEADHELLFDSGGLWRLYAQQDHRIFVFQAPMLADRPYKRAAFDADFTHGEVVLQKQLYPADEVCDPLEYPLDELLFINLLSRRFGAELHACGVEFPWGGAVFLGASGVGKTTLARAICAAQAGTVMSDDRIVVRESHGRFWMYGTPWHGEGRYAVAGRTPLETVYFLKQARRMGARLISPAEATARLMACSFLPFHDGDALQASLGHFERLVGAVECFELSVTLEAPVADFVREHAGGRR